MFSPRSETQMEATGLLPSLISDYLSQKDSLRSLYKYPFDLASFQQVIADKSKSTTDRKTLVEVLKKQYAVLPASKEVSDNIESLLSEKTFTVATAHQPALFLGPLYYIYKISSVINATKQLAKAYPEYRFIPVFWMGSEDHDIEELNHTFINGNKIEWPTDEKGAVGRIKTASLLPVIQALKSVQADSVLISILENGVKQFETFGTFTQYFIHEIFKEHGLVVIDQDNSALKKIFAEVIKDEVLNARAVQVLKPTLDFLETHYKVQAKPREINFFYLGDQFRERIVFNAATQKFEVNHTDFSFTREEMMVEIDAHPERFSPNVIFRPLFQEMILPNLAFVGGAGELSYWLELKPLFDYHGTNYPVQILRNSASILSPSTEKKLNKLNLKAADFFQEIESFITAYVQQHTSADASLEDEKKKVEALYDAIGTKAEAIDPTLKQNVAAEKQKALASIEAIEAKILKAEKKKQETSIAQIRNVHAALFPEGTLQERRENFIPYYSPEFINACVSNLNPFDRKFKFFGQGV